MSKTGIFYVSKNFVMITKENIAINHLFKKFIKF